MVAVPSPSNVVSSEPLGLRRATATCDFASPASTILRHKLGMHPEWDGPKGGLR